MLNAHEPPHCGLTPASLWRGGKLLRATLSTAFLAVVVMTTAVVDAKPLPKKYPRIANYYLTPTMSRSDALQLARWDIVILGVEHQYLNPDLLRLMREKNPDLIVLAYIPSEEIPLKYETLADVNNPHYQLLHGVADGWWLTDDAGKRLGTWPGTAMLNVTDGAPFVNGKRWNTYLPQFVHDTVMSTGFWDGIFYDNVWPDISWLNNGVLDINGNGSVPAAADIDRAWQQGMATLLATSRALEGEGAIIIGNGGGQYYQSLNGRLIEDFPSAADGGWPGATEIYLDVLERAAQPAVLIVNGKSSTATADDKQGMRYTLATTLLGNGFASFDKGQQEHAALWYFDEYRAYLGQPIGRPVNVDRPKDGELRPGVWRRDFQNGIVLVNSSDVARTIPLYDGYEQIAALRKATNAPPALVTSVRLAPADGILLLKRQFVLERGTYANGAFMRAFTGGGLVLRQGFFTYDEGYAGGATITKTDFTNDGALETVVTRTNRILVYNQRGFLTAAFRPAIARPTAAVQVAFGDVNGDGRLEIAVAAGEGPRSRVQLYSRAGRPLAPAFRPFPKTFSGTPSIALADVNGDGKAEVLVGAGRGSRPFVRIFSAAGAALREFRAYDASFRGGVSVAAGDVTNDGVPEIVTGPASGGAAHIRLFSAAGRPLTPGFFAFAQPFTAGVTVSIGDINRDHENEILVSTPTIY